MAIFAVSITKSVSFRGVQQEFSNVYHYSGTLPNATQGQLVTEAIANMERQFHSTEVAYVRGRLWSAGGSSASNAMIYQGNLTGFGSQVTSTSQDRERAVLIRFANGFDIRGRPKYLRKWYHSCGACVGVSFAATGIQQNTAVIPSADRTTIANAADDFLTITVNSVTYNLCSPSGTAAGTPVTVHQYLEHHQLGDMWR